MVSFSHFYNVIQRGCRAISGRNYKIVQNLPHMLDYFNYLGGSLYFYDRTRAEDESSSNLHALDGKRQCFSIFYDVNMSTNSNTHSEFSRFSFGEIP